MDKCHITLFDPWFCRRVRDQPKHFLERLNFYLKETSHKDRQFFKQIKLFKSIQIPQQMSPLSELLAAYLQQAVVSINIFPLQIP
jgi:hypothetical protein